MEQDRKSRDMFVTNCLKLIHEYSWLLDAFVLDFFTKDLWECLPYLWKEVLSHVKIEELGLWLQNSERSTAQVWPLSLIALRSAAKMYSLPREFSNIPQCLVRDKNSLNEDLNSSSGPLLPNSNFVEAGLETDCLKNENLKNLFLKHVKSKKRHETSIMANLCAKAARKAKCSYVIDVGAGKGHLSRLMAYGYGLKVCGIEVQSELIAAARKLDLELETTASKHLCLTYLKCLPRPCYLNTFLDCKTSTFNEFSNTLRDIFKISPEEEFCYGIVGLHPCGDLAPTLLRLFSKFKEAKFICIASCCYMKLNLKKTDPHKGYPLSIYFNSLPVELVSQTYEALEVSCHALESYCLRLQQKQYSTLKIHCYRAVLEKLIVKQWPSKRHLGLRSVKHYDELSFSEYAKIALSHVNLEVPQSELICRDALNSLQKWQKVVMWYSLRLLLAPLVETAVLLDRLYYLEEQEFNYLASMNFCTQDSYSK